MKPLLCWVWSRSMKVIQVAERMDVIRVAGTGTIITKKVQVPAFGRCRHATPSSFRSSSCAPKSAPQARMQPPWGPRPGARPPLGLRQVHRGPILPARVPSLAPGGPCPVTSRPAVCAGKEGPFVPGPGPRGSRPNPANYRPHGGRGRALAHHFPTAAKKAPQCGAENRGRFSGPLGCRPRGHPRRPRLLPGSRPLSVSAGSSPGRPTIAVCLSLILSASISVPVTLSRLRWLPGCSVLCLCLSTWRLSPCL